MTKTKVTPKTIRLLESLFSLLDALIKLLLLYHTLLYSFNHTHLPHIDIKPSSKMCKATTYLYKCGAAFHIILPCPEQCYTGTPTPDADLASTNPDKDEPTASSSASTIGNSCDSTSLLIPATNNAASDPVDSANKHNFHLLNTPAVSIAATNSQARDSSTPDPTPVNPCPRPLHRYRLPTPLTPYKTITPSEATSLIHDILDAPTEPTLIARFKDFVASALSILPKPRQALVWQDASELLREGVERRAARVCGECPPCEEERAREAAWACAATVRGED